VGALLSVTGPQVAIDPSLCPQIQGQADTEFRFFLALTFGLQDDPAAAMKQAIGFVEDVAARHGIPHPFQSSSGRRRRPGR